MIDLMPRFQVIRITAQVPYSLKVTIASPVQSLDIPTAHNIVAKVYTDSIKEPLLSLSLLTGGITHNPEDFSSVFIMFPPLHPYVTELPSVLGFSVVLTTVNMEDVFISHGVLYLI